MTLAHSLRKVGLRLGLDVQPTSRTQAARLSRMLRARAVDFVLDVGANVGDVGAALRRFGFSGVIASFEPLPAAFERLARRAAHDPRWHAFNVALGDRDGRASLLIAGNEGGASSSFRRMLPRVGRHAE